MYKKPIVDYWLLRERETPIVELTVFQGKKCFRVSMWMEYA